MFGSYAARYVAITLVFSSLFVVTQAISETALRGYPFTLDAYLNILGSNIFFVVLMPVAVTGLGYLAGRQRDRADAQTRYLDTTNHIIRTLSSSLDLDRILPEALQEIVAVLGTDNAGLYLFERDQLNLRATTPHMPDSLLNMVRQIQMEQWLPILLPKSKDQPLVTIDAGQDLPMLKDLQQTEYRQLISVMIPPGSQEIGLLLIASRRRAPLSREQADFLIGAANQIGVTMARAKPYAETRRRARDLDAIAQVNRTLLAGMGLDDLLDAIVNAAQVRFGLPYVAVLWVDEAAGEFFARASAGPLTVSTTTRRVLKLTEGLSARVYRTSQPYLARDVRSEPEFVPATDGPVLSSLLVPMTVAGKVIGIMVFDSLALDGFSEADVAALTTLADQVTIAAENARLYAEAQRERRRSTAILRSTRDVVMLIDPDGSVQLMNPAAERVLGVSAADGIGQPIEQILREPNLRDAYRWMSDRAPDDESPPREVMFSNGSTLLAALTSAKDESGTFFGRVLVMQDITYLKRLDQFKTQMVQMASHDLRNPLSVAMGYLELLTEDSQPLTPMRQQLLGGLEHALKSIQNLVTDLLDMEKIESGADRRRESIAIDQLIGRVVADFREQAQAKHQSLELSITPATPTVIGDPVRLKQAVSNLVGNAIKYTPDDGHIWVRLTCHDRQHVVLEVQDTGYGIPKSAMPKLFQRFFRAKARGTEMIEGTGLGLSLVKAVIEQHGGSISAESEEGQGSTFHVELPALKEADP